MGTGKRQCHTSRPPMRSCTLKNTTMDIRSFSRTSSDQTFGNGKTRFATFHGPIAASRTMLVAIRRAMSPRIRQLTGGNARSMTWRLWWVGSAFTAALQFGLRYPTRVSAIVSAAAGSGSSPSYRHAWLRESAVLARAFAERGPATMAEKIATSAARIQLKYKDPKRWQDFADQLRDKSGRGLSNTIVRCQALRPSLHDLRDQFSTMTTPVLLIVGDEDTACLETNLMLKETLANAGLWIAPNTGHTINLEEPAAFNAHLETFLGAVERQIWRRSYTTAKMASRRLSLEHKPEIRAPIHINH